MSKEEARAIFKQYFDLFLPEALEWRRVGDLGGSGGSGNFIHDAGRMAALCFREVTGLDYYAVVGEPEE